MEIKDNSLVQKHVPILDALRAIAALSVCFFHFICTVTGFISSKPILDIFSHGHYGVQMFFVISGFVIPWSLYHSSYKLKNYFTFAVKRIIRLEPLYIVSLALAITHTYLRAMSPHYNGLDITPSIKQILLHIGYLIPFFSDQTWIRPVYWTLAIEFQYYLAIGLMFPLIANKKIALRITSYVVLLSGAFFTSKFLPYFLPSFIFGIALCLYKTKMIGWIELSLLTLAAAIEMLVFHTFGTFAFSSFAFLAILFFTNYKNKILTFFGNISYSIYLFHSLTGLVFLNYISHSVVNPFYKFIMIIVALGITTLCSYLAYRFVELPSKLLSSKIKFKK